MKQVYQRGEIEPLETPRPAKWPLRAQKPYQKSTRLANVNGWKNHQRRLYTKAVIVAVIWLALLGLYFLI